MVGRARIAVALAAGLLAVLAAMLVGGLTGGLAQATGPAEAPARTPSAEPDVVLLLFHGEGCPHCAAEIDFIVDELQPAYPDLEVRAYEVWGNEANRALMVELAEVYGFEPGPVPVTVVDGPTGAQVIVGFGAATGSAIDAAVARQLAAAGAVEPEASAPEPAETVVAVPLVGEVDLAGSSALLATLVIGFVDGINPCSLWVLSVLLAIVLHSGSRGRVVLVGTVFLGVTAGMYAIYVAGVVSVLTVLESMVWIRVVVAAVALLFGLLQLRDGLRPDRPASLSISAERKPGLYRRMRAIGLGERGVVATVAGTVVLAAGVSLLETPCTAGLPLLWATLMVEQGVPTPTAVALFGVYMAVFLLDELVVFGVAVVTLRTMRLQQRHGQALKIVAGSVLVTLAAAMLLVPGAMQSVAGTLAVVGASVLLGTLIWLGAVRRGQARTQRVSNVPSSARTIDDSAKPADSSGDAPSVMRRA